MRDADIVIYGFDYEATEHIIDAYTQGIVDYTSTYINEGVHREDKLICHLRIKKKCHCPYISAGRADILHTRTDEDAARFNDWVREDGQIYIDDKMRNDCKQMHEITG